jgi:hypothetical protein
VSPHYVSASAGMPDKKRELNSMNFIQDPPLAKMSSPFDQKETRVEKVQAILQTRRSNVGSRKGNRMEPPKLETDYNEDELL